MTVSSRASFVQETSTTTGTGTYDLAGASTGYQGFVAGNGDGEVVRYSVTDGTDWEVCEGTITDASPDTLSRDTVLESSNSGSAVNWGAGTKTIEQVLTPAEVDDFSTNGKVLIQTIDNSSTAGSFSFTSIPGIYNRLFIKGWLKADVTAATTDTVYLFMNGDDTPGNYHSQQDGGSNNYSFHNEEAVPRIAYAVSSNGSVPSGASTTLDIVIERYADTSGRKAALGHYGYAYEDGKLTVASSFVSTDETGAITQIDIQTDNDPTDQLFGVLRLYGEY